MEKKWELYTYLGHSSNIFIMAGVMTVKFFQYTLNRILIPFHSTIYKLFYLNEPNMSHISILRYNINKQIGLG